MTRRTNARAFGVVQLFDSKCVMQLEDIEVGGLDASLGEGGRHCRLRYGLVVILFCTDHFTIGRRGSDAYRATGIQPVSLDTLLGGNNDRSSAFAYGSTLK